MKNGTLAFILTLLLFATGTTAIAFTLAMDATRIPSRATSPTQTIPWFCVRIDAPSKTTTPPPQIGIRNNAIAPTKIIDINSGKITRVPPSAIKETTKLYKAKPDSITRTAPTPPKTTPESRTQTPGYVSGNTGGSARGGSGGGSTISKNDGGTPPSPGYYNTGSAGNSSNSGGTFSVTLPDGSVSPGMFNNDAIYKYVSTCPPGYIANIGPICYEILTKKLSGKLTSADISSPAYSLCMDIVKSGLWNSKATPELCSLYNKYSNECSASQGKVCMLEKFVTQSGIPSKEILSMIGDLEQNCWLTSN